MVTAPYLRPVRDRRQPMFDQPFRIAHCRDASAYWTKDGWGPKAQATVYAAEDRSRVTLPEEGCWELVAPVESR